MKKKILNELRERKTKEKKNIYNKKAASHGTHMDSSLSIKVGYKFLKYEKKIVNDQIYEYYLYV